MSARHLELEPWARFAPIPWIQPTVIKFEPFLLDGAELEGVRIEHYSDGSTLIRCDLTSALWRYTGPPTLSKREGKR